MPTVEDVKRWLKQLGLQPRLLLVGYASQELTSMVKGLPAVPIVNANPHVTNAEIWRQAGKIDALVLLSSVPNATRDRIVGTFRHVLIKHAFEPQDDQNAVLDAAEDIVIKAKPVSKKTAKEKLQLTGGHHAPKKYPHFAQLCTSICELEQVTRVRFWQYKGQDLVVAPFPEGESARDSGTRVEIRVRTTDQYGLIVNIVCDHPDHVDQCVQLIRDLLEHHRR